MTSAMNGSKPTQDFQDFELISEKTQKPKVLRTPRDTQNPLTSCELILDAGSKRIKSVINGSLSTIEGIYKEVKGDLPHGLMGCFRYKGKNYVVGVATCNTNRSNLQSRHLQTRIICNYNFS